MGRERNGSAARGIASVANQLAWRASVADTGIDSAEVAR
jgi:hypothetical protein